MLQDSLRSAVHRSLTKPVADGCQNANQTATRRTNTHSKTSNSVEPLKNHSKREEKSMERRNKSVGPLKGSLDLEESLAILSKAQETSKRMSRLLDASESINLRRCGFQEQRHSIDGSFRDSLFKLEQRSEFVEEEIGRIKERTMNSRANGFQKPRFSSDGSSIEEVIRSQRYGVQEPRFSVSGSSRDAIEELRKVIRESLHQQNLLSRSPEDDRAYECNRFERFKGNLSNPICEPKKAKGSNLVAKLMGLEEVSSQTSHPIKMEEKKKSFNVQRPPFDMERRQAIKKKANQKRKSLQEVIEAMQFKGVLKDPRIDMPKIIPYRFDDKQLDMNYESPPIVIVKPLYLPQWERGEAYRKVLVNKYSRDEENQSFDHFQEKEVYDHGQMLFKSFNRKEERSIEKPKVDFSSVSHKQLKKEASKMRKKVNDKPNETKGEEKKDVRAKRMPISQSNRIYADHEKPDRRVSAAKDKVSLIKAESKTSANPVKEKKTPRAKSDRKPSTIKTNNKNCKDGKETNPVHKMDTFSEAESFPADKILQEIGKKGETCKKDEAQENPEVTKEVIHLDDTKPVIVEDDLMRLLLSSRSFLTEAKELYGVISHQPIHHQRKGLSEDVMRNAMLYLDIGKEIMSRKFHKHELSVHPLTESFTLFELAEEISSKIRVLTGFIKVDHSSIASDDISNVRLERDLRCKDMLMNSMWDIGWMSWAYPEDTRDIVCDVEESILSWLMEEVALDLVY
ncbi:uncharacterized protein A4U43_C06F16590 [Asparagus officinalis]|uniref:DUF4378 domain-containing protein n=1 Tax=Asparagus officinalis TaxID=4686 RepID=A0A5P1EMK4_ASPOF|nr:uncharacterized protein LOC109846448 [Asparagus officinalis]ONK67156.1 uncharacterized protein A4U43_C06F16590 [Asparagus officinalis]